MHIFIVCHFARCGPTTVNLLVVNGHPNHSLDSAPFLLMTAHGYFKQIKPFIKNVAICMASALVVQHYIAGHVLCTGPSMEPTIYSGDILLTDRFTPRLREIAKGDVVIASNPTKCENVCKRVVAVDGESVLFDKKVLKIPENHYWLEGDNKINSSDSRNYGPVPARLIRSRCICKIWPKIDCNFKDAVTVYCDARVQIWPTKLMPQSSSVSKLQTTQMPKSL